MRHYDSPGYIGDQLASHFDYLKNQMGVDLSPKYVVLGSKRYPHFSGVWHRGGGDSPTPTWKAEDLRISNWVHVPHDEDRESIVQSHGYIPLESGHLLETWTSTGGVRGQTVQIKPGWGDRHAMDEKGIGPYDLDYEAHNRPVEGEAVNELIRQMQQIPVTQQSMDLNRRALERASIFHRAAGLSNSEIPFNVYKQGALSYDDTLGKGAYDPSAQSFRFIR